MRKRAARAGLIFLETAAIIIAIFGAGIAFLYWRVEQGPVALSIFKPSVKFAIERRLPEGYRTQLDTVTLSRAGDGGGYALSLDDVRVFDPDKREAVFADNVEVVFRPGDFFSGKVGPRSVLAEGMKFNVVRSVQQTIEIPAVKETRKKHPMSFLPSVLEGELFESAFDRAEMLNAEITFLDQASGKSWISENASVSIERKEGSFVAELNGDIDMQGTPAALRAKAKYVEESGLITLDAEGEQFPVGDILSMFYGDGAAIVDAPVSGKASFSLTTAGDVLSSSFDAHIGQGALILGGKQSPLEFVEWRADFDPSKNEFSIENFAFDVNGSTGALQGKVELDFGHSVRDPETIRFDLAGEELVINAPGFFEKSVPIDTAAVAGAYSITADKVNFDKIDLSLLGVDLDGDFSMELPDDTQEENAPSREIMAHLEVTGALDPERLLNLWPLGVAMGVRDWIADRMETADIENIVGEINLPRGAVGEGGLLPEDGLRISFDVSNAKAFYVKSMTPIERASGKGLLTGNSFRMEIDKARIGTIALSQGEVEFPVLIPKWEPTYYRFTAVGASEDMLTVLNQEPLRLLSKINLEPGQFAGEAKARFQIMRPNKREVEAKEYEYSGSATFEKMHLSKLAGDIELMNAHGTVDLKSRSVTITSKAQFEAAPVEFTWKQNFYEEDGPSSFEISGRVEASAADFFGVKTRQYVRGPVSLEAKALGPLGSFSSLDVKADFSDAVATINSLGWRKEAGVPATASFNAAFTDTEASVKNIVIEGEAFAIDGQVTFREGQIAQSDFPRFYLGDVADLSIKSQRRASGELEITALGRYLDAAALIANALEDSSDRGEDTKSSWGAGLFMTARIDEIRIREGVSYRDTSLDLWRDADGLQSLNFSALDQTDMPLRVVMAHTGDETNEQRTVTATTSDLGGLFRGLFGVNSIRGGEGSIAFDLSTPDRKGLSGVIEARNFHVVEAPLLARVFSAGSLDGLSNLLNGEGIDFADAYGVFDLSNGNLFIEEFHATGTSVGMTASGDVALGEGGELKLSGAVAPIYQLNSVLGNTPVIGDILVGKKGEGILALSYSVTGLRTEPTVFVNPLSALTPGIFRQMFEPTQTSTQHNEPAPAESE